MKAAWLLRDGNVLASAEVVEPGRSSSFCLSGREAIEGALVVRRTVLVHTVRARAAVDAAFLDEEMVVVATVRLRPWRLARPPRGTRTVLHAGAGSFERWGLGPGDKLELRETS